MIDYEILLMLDPELTAERSAEIVTRVRERIESDGGIWEAHEPWGRRKLAYEIDYKNANQLRRYVSEKGKIRSRRITGACRRHQRQVAVAIKRAREMALLPYATG